LSDKKRLFNTSKPIVQQGESDATRVPLYSAGYYYRMTRVWGKIILSIDFFRKINYFIVVRQELRMAAWA